MLTNYIRFKYDSSYGDNFKHWLKMHITTCNEPIYSKDGKKITHEEYLNYFANSIKTIITQNNYVIVDENKFKDEIDNFIYTLSDNSRHG